MSWHTRYDRPGSTLAQRLAEVRRQVGLALDRAAPGRIRLLSLCAGDGRDVLPVLATHPRAADVTARLVELDPQLAAMARASAPPAVEVVEGDAGTTAAAAGIVPVDVLLLCGIFGNITEEDLAGTVAAVPALLAGGATVVWTRGTREPDITPRLRSWFAAAGVVETSFVTGPGRGGRSGRACSPGRRLCCRRTGGCSASSCSGRPVQRLLTPWMGPYAADRLGGMGVPPGAPARRATSAPAGDLRESWGAPLPTTAGGLRQSSISYSRAQLARLVSLPISAR